MTAGPTRPATAGSIVAARAVAIALGLVTAPLLARSLGPQGRGVAAAALAALAVAPVIIALGLPMAVRRRAAFEDDAAVLRAARLVVTFLSVPSVVLGVLVAVLLLDEGSPTVRALFVVGMALSPAFVSVLCDQSILIVRNQYRRVAALQLAQPVTYASGIIAGGIAGRLTVEWAVGAFVVATTVTAVFTAGLVRVGLRGRRVPARPLVREGLSYAGSQAAESAANRIDQVLAVSVIGSGQAGLYAVAVTIAAIPVSFGHAIGAVLFRDLAVGGARLKEVEARGVRMALLSGVAAALALAAVTPWGVPLVFGPEFRDAVPVVLTLLLSGPAVVAGYVATVTLAAENRGRAMTAAQAAGLVVGVTLLYVIGPPWGAAGAAAASAAGYWTTMVLAIGMLGPRAAALVPRRADVADMAGVLGVRGRRLPRLTR